MNKKDLITAHQSWKREDFDPDDVFEMAKVLPNEKSTNIFCYFPCCSTSMVVRNLSEYFDQRVLTPKSVAPKLQIFQRGRTENALLEEKYISQQHAT